jgi:hypothetical protein
MNFSAYSRHTAALCEPLTWPRKRIVKKIQKKFAVSKIRTTFAIPFGGQTKFIDNTERENEVKKKLN